MRQQPWLPPLPDLERRKPLLCMKEEAAIHCTKGKRQPSPSCNKEKGGGSHNRCLLRHTKEKRQPSPLCDEDEGGSRGGSQQLPLLLCAMKRRNGCCLRPAIIFAFFVFFKYLL
nr:hypothetical protein Itr_chr04CG16150 [Ipomoea trifida]